MKLFYSVLLLVSFQVLLAQNQLGLHTSNYSGANSLGYNPASFHASNLKWDVSIVSGGAFVENEYAYIENTNLITLLTTDKPLVQRVATDAYYQDQSVIFYNFYDATKAMNNSYNGFVGLPSFAVRLNKKWSIGAFSKARSAISANNVDKDLDYYSVEYWRVGDTKDFSPINTAGLLWNEFGINLGFTVSKKWKRTISMGVNLKYLSGLQAMYLYNPNHTSVLMIPDEIYAKTPKLNYGFSDIENLTLNGLGSGVGVDVGFVYVANSHDQKPYKWKLGASLTDVGAIKMKFDSEAHEIAAANNVNINLNAFNQVQGLGEFSDALSDQALGDPNASLQTDYYRIVTPAALYLDFDYALSPFLFVNASLNRRLKVYAIEVQKENYMAISGRFETRNFEIGVPIVLYDDRDLRPGLWLRFQMLTIGSDHVGSLFVDQKQFTGSDFYFSLSVNEFTFKKNKSALKRNNVENCFY